MSKCDSERREMLRKAKAAKGKKAKAPKPDKSE
jgi:hypothetical protein